MGEVSILVYFLDRWSLRISLTRVRLSPGILDYLDGSSMAFYELEI